MMNSAATVVLSVAVFLLRVSDSSHDVREPAVIVLRPPEASTVRANSQTLRFTCVAYGLPLPTITWSSTCLTDAGVTVNEVRILSTNKTINGRVFQVSVLELCGVESANTTQCWCTADNGVTGNRFASSSARFNITLLPKEDTQIAISVATPLAVAGGIMGLVGSILGIVACYGNHHKCSISNKVQNLQTQEEQSAETKDSPPSAWSPGEQFTMTQESSPSAPPPPYSP